MDASVLPRYTSTPCRKGSVLLCLILIRATVGSVWLSTARSDRLRCTCGSYASLDGTVNSPARRNPKNPTHAAAQSIQPSGCVDVPVHACLRCRIMSRVIGSLTLDGTIPLDSTRFIPARTYSKRAIDPLANGLPRDFWIWRYLIPDKYALMVLCFRFCSAR